MVAGHRPGLLRGALARTPRASFRWTAYALGVTAFGAGVPTPLYPVYEQNLGFTAGVLGLVFAGYTLGVFVTLFFVAPQAERAGRKQLLYLGMALTALSAVIFAFATNVGWLAVARIVSGLAVGATTSVATAAMSDLEPRRDQHHVARVAVGANFGAFAIGVLLSGFLVQYAAYPTELVYLLPVVASGVGIAAIRSTPETGSAVGTQGTLRAQRIAVPAEIRQAFWVSVAGIVACYSIYGLFAALVPSYLRQGLGLSNAFVTGVVVALLFGLAALVQLSTARIRDRRALLVGFPLLLISLVGLVLVLPQSSTELVLVVSAALGVSVGLTFMGSVTLIDRVAPEATRGEILAGFYLAGYLALAVPTIGVAEASDRIGLVNAGILFGAILAVAVAFAWWGAYRTPTPPGGEGHPRGSADPR